MKLPEIVLKKFDGNPINVQGFWDSYDTKMRIFQMSTKWLTYLVY